MSFTDAVAQCESDGAYLAFPKHLMENIFISALAGADDRSQSWIGVHDSGKDGSFVSIDETDFWGEKWGDEEPRDWNTARGVIIDSDKLGEWYTRPKTPDVKFPFTCFNKIKCEFNHKY